MSEPTSLLCEWPEISLRYGLSSDTRLAANALVRSAMFSTLDFSGAAERSLVAEPLRISTIKPYRIEQIAGARLSQSDAELFFVLLSRLYRNGTPQRGAAVYFSRREICTELGRSRGGKTDTLLDESLQRLCSAEFEYEVLGSHHRTTLLSHADRFIDDRPYDYKITIADLVAPLLEAGEWLVLQGKVRKQLAADPLAVGLHAFYASHQRAYPMLTSTLKALMSRETMQESKWKSALSLALERVQAATGWMQCEVARSGPYEGKVVVQTGIIRRKKPKKTARPAVDTMDTAGGIDRAESLLV